MIQNCYNIAFLNNVIVININKNKNNIKYSLLTNILINLTRPTFISVKNFKIMQYNCYGTKTEINKIQKSYIG